MASHRIRPLYSKGLVKILPSPGLSLEMIEFDLVRLGRGESVSVRTGGDEAAAVMLSGSARVGGGGLDEVIGGRMSVFDGPGASAFWPRESELTIEAHEGLAELALARVRAADVKERAEAFVVRPEEVEVAGRGTPPFEREIRNMIVADRPASRMVLGETVNRPGQWSSYPPHRHERDEPPDEVEMEEVYYFRVRPPQGFGFIRLYTDDRSLDEAYAVEDGDVVALPRGYHPVSSAPGYSLYYLWVLAGRTSRDLKPRDDPAHEWVLKAKGKPGGPKKRAKKAKKARAKKSRRRRA